uniref:Uncharacterized protein n=1 Tax=Panagrolaimus sp. ES5 TaxID=591445 RepID=A0AC34GXW1_9BILA
MADPSENQDIKAAGNNSEEKHVHWNLMEQHYTGTKHVPKRRTRVNSKVNYGNDDDEYVWCDEFKICQNTPRDSIIPLERDIELGGYQDKINNDKKQNITPPRIKETFLKNFKNRFSIANKGSSSFSEPLPPQKRHQTSEEEIFTTYESGIPTTADIGLPLFIATSCTQVHHASPENIANYFDLKDPKTNYVLQKAHYFDSDSDKAKKNSNGEYLRSNFGNDEQLPCLQILSNSNSSDHPPIRLGQEIDQKVVENKYYTDDGNICVSPNVANCNLHNCFPYETKSEFDYDIRF